MNPGPISKTITITTNAINKENGMVALRIKGNVIVKEEKAYSKRKMKVQEYKKPKLNLGFFYISGSR